MYKKFFGLTKNPFGSSPDIRFLFTPPHVLEALASVEHGVSARKGFVVLTGKPGTGKTTLLRKALASPALENVATAFLFNPKGDALDFYELMLSDFGVSIPARTKSGMLLQLNQWLLEQYQAGVTCAVFVDEAHTVSDDVLDEIRMLGNLETSSEHLLQIVLCGQPKLAERLHEPVNFSLCQRIALWCQTVALSSEQTSQYVVERMHVAGAQTSDIFTAEALEKIFSLSHGVPRVIHLLCEISLMLAYVEQQLKVSGAIVQSAAADLNLDTHAEELTPGETKPRRSSL